METALPKDEPFVYEKTVLCELAPRPSAFAFSLLKKMYANNGPVWRAYKRHGINYEDTDFFVIVDGQLYIDRERELVSLFPILSRFRSPDFFPLPVRFFGMRRSFNNFLSFNGLNGKFLTDHRDALRAALARPLGGHLDERVAAFLADEETVFDVNILADKIAKSLEIALKGDKLTVREMLALPADDLVSTVHGWSPPADLIGNSLDPADRSVFVANAVLSFEPAAETKLAKIPHWKRKMVLPMIRQVQCYALMREYGRWLRIKHVSGMRSLVIPETVPSEPDLPVRLSSRDETPDEDTDEDLSTLL